MFGFFVFLLGPGEMVCIQYCNMLKSSLKDQINMQFDIFMHKMKTSVMIPLVSAMFVRVNHNLFPTSFYCLFFFLQKGRKYNQVI